MGAAIVREPIYHQINQALRRLIREGRFREGQQFLTERQVSLEYSVSRATANKAVSTLVAEGVLELRKGVGTFVRGGALDYDLRALVSFTDRARAAGKTPATRILERQVLLAAKAPAGVARALSAAPADRLVFMVRLRLVDRVPVILERRWVSAALCPGLEKSHLEDSLYSLWTNRYGLVLEGADQSIRAVRIEGQDARSLRVPGGAAGLLVRSTGYIEDGAPLWFERTLYRGDAYEFQNRLGGLRSARPAVGALLTGGPHA